MIRPLLIYPHPMLRGRSYPVDFQNTDLDKRIPELVVDLVDTMRKSHGAGLSAIQIGIPLRIFALAADGDHLLEDIVVVNPIVELVGDRRISREEGCLSFPDQTVVTRRQGEVVVRGVFFDALGVRYNMESLELDGVPAQAAQHELEHLDGKLLIDHASGLAKSFIEKRMRNLSDRLAKKYRAEHPPRKTEIH